MRPRGGGGVLTAALVVADEKVLRACELVLWTLKIRLERERDSIYLASVYDVFQGVSAHMVLGGMVRQCHVILISGNPAYNLRILDELRGTLSNPQTFL